MKKLITIVLSMAMVLCYIPMMAYADTTDISKGYSIGAIEDQAYTGSAITPAVTVSATSGGSALASSNYTVAYANNIQAGQATVTVTGTGTDYSGTLTKTFNIKKTVSDNIPNSVAIDAIANQAAGTTLSASSVVVRDNGSVLRQGTDYTYTVSGTDSKTAVGTNTLTVEFKGSYYIGTLSKTFVGEYNINDCYDVTCTSSKTSREYNPYVAASSAGEVCDNITVTKKSAYSGVASLPATLVLNTDYTVEYSGNKAVGTPTVKITSKGTNGLNGSITKSAGFTITAKPITSSTITTSLGAGNVPIVKDTVSGNPYTLVAGTDYSMYPNGTSYTITGINNYTGTTTVNGTANDLSGCTITFAGFDYLGQPTYTVMLGSKILTRYTDYNITYTSSLANQPYYYVTLMPGTNGLYTGTKASTIVYSNNKDLSSCSINFAGFTSSGYPTFTVYNGSTKLTELSDYYISYSPSAINQTSYTVTLTPGYSKTYTGTKYQLVYTNGSYSLANATVYLSGSSFTYTGSQIRPTVSSVYVNGVSVSSYYYDVTYGTNTLAGTGTVTITGKNGYSGSKTTTFTIVGATINNCTISLSQSTYAADGTAKTPTVTVRDGYTILSAYSDYTVTYASNITAGTASVTVTGKGKYSGSKTVNFIITGLPQTMTLAQESYVKYPGSDSFALSPTATGDGTGFTFVSSDNSVVTVTASGVVSIVGTGRAYITVTTAGVKKYAPVSKQVVIQVKPKKPIISVYNSGSGQIKVRITKVVGATKYQIRYGRMGEYTSAYSAQSTDSYLTQTRTISNLEAGKMYYVKVRSYKTMSDGTKVWGNWTTVKKVRA